MDFLSGLKDNVRVDIFIEKIYKYPHIIDYLVKMFIFNGIILICLPRYYFIEIISVFIHIMWRRKLVEPIIINNLLRAKKAGKMISNKPLTENIYLSFQNMMFSSLFYLINTLIIRFMNLPIIINLLLNTILYSVYCLDYKWSYYNKKLSHIHSHIFYYIGFGLPVVILEYIFGYWGFIELYFTYLTIISLYVHPKKSNYSINIFCIHQLLILPLSSYITNIILTNINKYVSI